MRNSVSILLMAGAISLGGCAENHVPNTVPISVESGESGRVHRALDNWPKVAESGESPLKRPFFTTIHVAGRRVTASGIMQYYGPLDFRITAVTEMGVILFDGRINWAGVTVLRSLPGMDKGIVETLVKDLSRAFDLPSDLSGLTHNSGKLYLRKTPADTHQYTWTFDGETGRLVGTEVELGLLDTLRIDYRSYDLRGWPEEVVVTRKARLLEVIFTFTDNHVVQRDVGRVSP